MMANLFKYFYLILLFSTVMIFFLNPGIPERKYFHKNFEKEEGKAYFICKKCNLMAAEELNIVHCDICNICILKHDHHCNMIEKCIGKGNKIFFICILISLFLFLFSAFFIIFIIFKKIYNK